MLVMTVVIHVTVSVAVVVASMVMKVVRQRSALTHILEM
jgi:hypothetical protein